MTLSEAWAEYVNSRIEEEAVKFKQQHGVWPKWVWYTAGPFDSNPLDTLEITVNLSAAKDPPRGVWAWRFGDLNRAEVEGEQ